MENIQTDICLYTNYTVKVISLINELVLIKLITANENNFSLQLNFKGLN